MLPERLQTELNISTGDVEMFSTIGCINLSESVSGQRSERTGHQRIVFKDWIFFLSVLQCFFELKWRKAFCSICWGALWQRDPSEQVGGAWRVGGLGWGCQRGKHDGKKDELMAASTFNVIVSLCLCLSRSFPPKLNMANLSLFFGLFLFSGFRVAWRNTR